MEELESTLLFLTWEEDDWFYRWERILGLVWTSKDIQVLAKMAARKKEQTDKASPTSLSPDSVIRYPLSLLVRPELLDTLTGSTKDEGEALSGMMNVPHGTMSLSNVSKEEFLARVGASSASSTDIDLGRGDRPPLFNSPSSAPSGFRNK